MNINLILSLIFFVAAFVLYLFKLQDGFQYYAFLSLFNLGVAIYFDRK